jgi:hypothetical protein
MAVSQINSRRLRTCSPLVKRQSISRYLRRGLSEIYAQDGVCCRNHLTRALLGVSGVVLKG